MVGTPQFMAPEQLEGGAVDARTDLYACGLVLFEIFTGHLPFPADASPRSLIERLHAEPPSPRGYWPEIPERLDRAIVKCLQTSPGDRFGRAEELLAELEALSA